MTRSPFVLLLLLLLASCAADTAPCEPGPEACVEPTWESIHAVVITDSCAVPFCHGDAEGNNGANLDLRGLSESYALLSTVSASDECGALGLPLVAPADPDGSLFYQKLFATGDGDAAVCGFRMPYAGDPLPTQWTEAVRAWIAEGAPGP